MGKFIYLLGILLLSAASVVKAEEVISSTPGEVVGETEERPTLYAGPLFDFVESQFTPEELQEMPRGSFKVEHLLCQCPPEHLLVIHTPKKSLAIRAQYLEGAIKINPFATIDKKGEYCDMGEGGKCYGNQYTDACDFVQTNLSAEMLSVMPSCKKEAKKYTEPDL